MTEIIGFIIGIMIFAAGIYYLIKERNDSEAKKNIYHCYGCRCDYCDSLCCGVGDVSQDKN